MLLNILINYDVFKELICQDRYKKIKLEQKDKKSQICQHCQLCVNTEKTRIFCFVLKTGHCERTGSKI